MTILEFLNSFWALIVGMLMASVPGAWALYTLIIKDKLSGGRENMRADLAQKNIDLAQKASEYSEKLQSLIEEKEAVIVEKEKSIQDHLKEIDDLKNTVLIHEAKIREQDTRIINLERELKDEKIKTGKQETMIEYLMAKIKRPEDARQRSTDTDLATFPAGTVIPEDKIVEPVVQRAPRNKKNKL